MTSAQHKQLRLRRFQISIRELLVDMLLLAVCAAMLRSTRDRLTDVAILCISVVLAILSGHVCKSSRDTAHVGVFFGSGILWPMIAYALVFASHSDNRGWAIVVSLILAAFLIPSASLFFVIIYWLQHWEKAAKALSRLRHRWNMAWSGFSKEDGGMQPNCPFCNSTAPPVDRVKTSDAGWVTFTVLCGLIVTIPFCWIGLRMSESVSECENCGLKR